MKATILVPDKLVVKDGIGFSGIDMSGVPENVHALQWFEDRGWLEFSEDENFIRPPNQILQTIPDWAAPVLARWLEVKRLYDAQQRAFTHEIVEVHAVASIEGNTL